MHLIWYLLFTRIWAATPLVVHAQPHSLPPGPNMKRVKVRRTIYKIVNGLQTNVKEIQECSAWAPISLPNGSTAVQIFQHPMKARDYQILPYTCETINVSAAGHSSLIPMKSANVVVVPLNQQNTSDFHMREVGELQKQAIQNYQQPYQIATAVHTLPSCYIHQFLTGRKSTGLLGFLKPDGTFQPYTMAQYKQINVQPNSADKLAEYFRHAAPTTNTPQSFRDPEGRTVIYAEKGVPICQQRVATDTEVGFAGGSPAASSVASSVSSAGSSTGSSASSPSEDSVRPGTSISEAPSVESVEHEPLEMDEDEEYEPSNDDVESEPEQPKGPVDQLLKEKFKDKFNDSVKANTENGSVDSLIAKLKARKLALERAADKSHLKQKGKVDKAKEAYRNLPAVDRMLLGLTEKEKGKVFKDSRTRAGKKIIAQREEGSFVQRTKNMYLFKGNKASEVMQSFLKDMFHIRKPNCVYQSRKNQKDMHPFDDATRVEKTLLMSNCPLFMMVSTSKKRPNRVVMGRTFNREILDMVEFGLEAYQPMSDFASKITGSKAMTLFQGSLWDSSSDMQMVQSLLSEMFIGPLVKRMKFPEGIERLHVLTATADNAVEFHHYKIEMKKSGTEVPNVELQEIGPSFRLKIDRVKAAPEAVMKEALWLHKSHMKKSKTQMKGRERNEFGDVVGRVHMGGKQDLSKVFTPLSVENMEKQARKKQQKRTGGGGDDDLFRPDTKDVFSTEVDI